MREICKEDECLGCAACADGCPRQCITMVANRRGFKTPLIDENRCADCSRCRRICPANRPPCDADTNDVLAAVNRDDGERIVSSSGGVFSLLAREALGESGFVYGAKQSSALDVRHVCISKPEEIAALRGSKYIPSDMDGSYRKIAEQLRQRLLVLFCGTPCQVYALKSYLGGSPSGLTTVDFACHGVLSPLALQQYLKEQGFERETTVVNWRDKNPDGWHHIGITLREHPPTVKEKTQEFCKSSIGGVYIAGLLLRDCCYSCKRKGVHSCADITLGDYWGVESIHPEMDDQRGTSVVIAHTDEGRRVLKRSLAQMAYVASDFSKAARENPGLRNSDYPTAEREEAFALLESKGLSAVYRKYVRKNVFRRLLGKISREAHGPNPRD